MKVITKIWFLGLIFVLLYLLNTIEGTNQDLDSTLKVRKIDYSTPGGNQEQIIDPNKSLITENKNIRSKGSESESEVNSQNIQCTSRIKTSNGLISGKLIRTDTEKDVCAYLGIPYAKPPIGQLRFKRPVQAGNWEGTYEATKISNTCTQTTWGADMVPIPKNYNISEDCLYLNIWVPLPVVIKNRTLDISTSVMVWIHEGGFSVGSSTVPAENGAVLSGEKSVIVASMQYRLGPLGFLYFGIEDAPGNVGLLDQNLALQWINANIQQFGGNKEEITLFGESAGSFSISHHLLSPLSRNLFKRGIMMSGASISSIIWRTKSEAINFSYKVAESVGCWNPKIKKNLNTTFSDILECMRNIDSIHINQFQHKPKYFLDLPTSPTIDDYFLTDTPANLLKSSENSSADLIIGAVKDEGSLLLLSDYPKYFSLSVNPIISYNTFVIILRDMFRDRPIFEQDAIITHYTNWKNLDDSGENVRRLVALAGDYIVVCPIMVFARQWSTKGLKVYFYWFTQTNEVLPKWIGAAHTFDIEYIFGGPLTKSNRPKNEQDLSKKIQELFTNFAKTGIPSKNWATYTSAYPVFLDLNATLISDQTTNNIFGPRAADCRFWNYELPLLREYHSRSVTCTASGDQLVSPSYLNKKHEYLKSENYKEDLA